MSSSFVAFCSGAGASDGLTLVLWLTAQPPQAKPAAMASELIQVNPRSLSVLSPQECKRCNLAAGSGGVNETRKYAPTGLQQGCEGIAEWFDSDPGSPA